MWTRYHDDCLALLSNRIKAKTFFAAIKLRARPVFCVLAEGVYSSGSNFTYLDLDIHMTVAILEIEASQVEPVVPLCPTSAHAPCVHKSWPGAVCSLVFSLSDSKPGALSTLRERYVAANAHHLTVARFQIGALLVMAR